MSNAMEEFRHLQTLNNSIHKKRDWLLIFDQNLE